MAVISHETAGRESSVQQLPIILHLMNIAGEYVYLLSTVGLVIGRSKTPPPLPPVAAVQCLLARDTPHAVDTM